MQWFSPFLKLIWRMPTSHSNCIAVSYRCRQQQKNGQFIRVSLTSGIRVRPGKSRNPLAVSGRSELFPEHGKEITLPLNFLPPPPNPTESGNMDSAFPHVPPKKLIPVSRINSGRFLVVTAPVVERSVPKWTTQHALQRCRTHFSSVQCVPFNTCPSSRAHYSRTLL